MNAAGDGGQLPKTIGGVVDLAVDAYLERAPLYLLFSAVLIAVGVALDYLVPAADARAADLRLVIVDCVEVVLTAYVIAAVALAVAGRIAGERPTTRALLRGALVRWPSVAVTLLLVDFIVTVTAPAGALMLPLDDPITLLLAPFVWLFWGALALAPPLTALSTDRGVLATLVSLFRALGFGLRAVNLVRLALVALATIAPALLEVVLYDAASHHGFPHASFWTNVPLDALCAPPLTALQTAFALDFARRVVRLNP